MPTNVSFAFPTLQATVMMPFTASGCPWQSEPEIRQEEAALYYEKESGALYFVAGLAIGAVFGASIALLTAPQSGKRTRRRVVRAVSAARHEAGDKWGDMTDQVKRIVRRGRRRMRR